MLTIKEVALDLKVDEVTVARWLRAGLLKGKKIGGSLWRVEEQDLEAFKKWQEFPKEIEKETS